MITLCVLVVTPPWLVTPPWRDALCRASPGRQAGAGVTPPPASVARKRCRPFSRRASTGGDDPYGDAYISTGDASDAPTSSEDIADAFEVLRLLLTFRASRLRLRLPLRGWGLSPRSRLLVRLPPSAGDC